MKITYTAGNKYKDAWNIKKWILKNGCEQHKPNTYLCVYVSIICVRGSAIYSLYLCACDDLSFSLFLVGNKYTDAIFVNLFVSADAVIDGKLVTFCIQVVKVIVILYHKTIKSLVYRSVNLLL